RIESRQLAQNFLGPLVSDARDGNLDLHKFVAAHAGGAQRRRTLPAQSKLLPALRAGRNFDGAGAVDGGHFNFRAQGRFGKCHWNLHVNVVAFAFEDGVSFDLGHDIEVARRAAIESRVAFARHANARSRIDAGGNADFKRLWPAGYARPAAGGAARPGAPAAVALRASAGKTHVADLLSGFVA